MNGQKTYHESAMRLAGKILIGCDARPVDSMNEALTVILASIGEHILAGADQIPEPGNLAIEACSVSACFMAACSVPMLYNLQENDLLIDAVSLMHRTGDRVFKNFSENDRTAIIDSGIRLFREIVSMAHDNQRLEEWMSSAHNVTDKYILTEGKTDCVELFAPLYMVLLMATKQIKA
jgi:hypothetical protein